MSTIDNNTKLSVTNNTDEAVEVYVTFAAENSENKCCPSPVAVGQFGFLTKVNDLRGKFTLGANQTQLFDAEGRCFSGNIGFYIPPQCPVAGADFHHGKTGTSIAEFTLNPSSPCAEAFDISCVNGVNCFIEVKVEKGLGWSYGPESTPITRIYNRGLQENEGNPGVYPVNCTDCVRLVGDAPCPTLPIGPAQSERICNVQRSERGGVVQVILNTPVPA
ncbi:MULTISPECIES: hypothetical protein [Reichenbachiella]|uniref:Uncharacterized protein n=1 Tax=Reichenbachiella agariperforans TaxID=156994 RepID=A0A1M6N2F3_REIAG|nr:MULTISPECIES: hypothetical protein [Reichenbachiella]MBU2915695.1 hypothetical protein [Reichenbachiella agariperforans]RJE72036.1 hypothetical protein BGP76_08135 [Reichenbachiella sp. MSK19-1]SHJ89909.1 hypothetical protein SAMN04488028_10270 [Reichenbachiella agariperforans]